MRADLHVHTNASDGQYSPSEVVVLARGFDLIAITDHDTIDGIAPARAAARAQGSPLIVAGIELSTAEDAGDIHMLGYFIDPDDLIFQATLREFQQARLDRGRLMVERLAASGVLIEWARVAAIAGDGAVGRPHIARALIEAGYVESVREAFERYIGNDAPAYVARKRLTPEGAIDLIHSAGGVAVLAHPGLVERWRTILSGLIVAGLDGVEVFHPSNDVPTRLDLRAWALRHDLIMTGGSDFHGEKVKPGNALGSMAPPEGAVYALQTRAQRYQAKEKTQQEDT
ncbi:MAG: PHP domain-containing protein [Chloroflexota bacterium]|nr:PHP domain-containing protein [Chloroflexota bacterium]